MIFSWAVLKTFDWIHCVLAIHHYMVTDYNSAVGKLYYIAHTITWVVIEGNLKKKINSTQIIHQKSPLKKFCNRKQLIKTDDTVTYKMPMRWLTHPNLGLTPRAQGHESCEKGTWDPVGLGHCTQTLGLEVGSLTFLKEEYGVQSKVLLCLGFLTKNCS